MTRRPRIAPIWLMGLSNCTFGLYAGFVVVPLPQLLAARHVPVPQIAAITAAAFSPGFWVFLLGPMLDVRFSRRWYATTFAAIAAVALTLSVLFQQRLIVLETLLITGYIAASLSHKALGGWLAGIVSKQDEGRLSSWYTIASIGGGGLMAILANELLHRLPLTLAAVVLGLCIFLPATVFLFIPAPGPDRRLARESFGRFFGEVLALLRKREVVLALLLFLAPSASFALTNTLGGLGRDFQASEHIVSLLGGTGAIIAGIAGSLLFVPLTRYLPLRWLYLAIGSVGALFTLLLMLLPHSQTTFGVAMVGENIFQALAFCGITAIAFDTIGHNNPLAATQFSLFNSAGNLPLIYMQVADGHFYATHGVTGMYAADGGISLVACAALGVMLTLLLRRRALSEGLTVQGL